MKMESGFIKADSANLPKVDTFMVANFIARNHDICSAEFRNAKISSHQSYYGDDAIGFVQLKKEENLCIIKSKINPERGVCQQAYTVSMIINETEGAVLSIQCADCPDSSGGCTHALALLMWTHRRSEEPAFTNTKCYWKKSELSKVEDTSQKYIKIKEMGSSVLGAQDKVFSEFLKERKKRKLQNSQIFEHQINYYEDDVVQSLSLHYLCRQFNALCDCDDFLNQIRPVFTEKNIAHVERQTREQHKSPAWHKLLYARITASKAFEVTRCKTADSSVVATLLGAKVPDNMVMKRGRVLAEQVKDELKQQLGEISQCGLFISQEYPMIAASPDGILNGDTVIEIKCPLSEKKSQKYFSKNQVTAKYFTQVQLQMHLTKLKKCLFCLASCDFEETKNIIIVCLEYDLLFVENILRKLESYWKKNIYPLIYKSTK